MPGFFVGEEVLWQKHGAERGTYGAGNSLSFAINTLPLRGFNASSPYFFLIL